MKKIILGLIAVVTVATADAQKNSVLLYGNVGLNMHSTDWGATGPTKDWMGWNVNPGIGYQFSHHFTLGIQAGVGGDKAQDVYMMTGRDSIFTQTWGNWNVGIFGRYTHYFNNMFSIWNQLDVSYIGGTMTTKREATIIRSTEDSYNGFRAMFTPAIGINVHDGLALNFSFGGVGFSSVMWDNNATGMMSDVMDTRFNVTFGNQFNFGISKNFGCSPNKRPHEPGMENRRMKKAKANDDDDE